MTLEECVRNRSYGSRMLHRVVVVTGLVGAVLFGAAGRAAPSHGVAALGAIPPGPADSATVVATVDRFHAAVAGGDSLGALALLAPDAVVLESGVSKRATSFGRTILRPTSNSLGR